MKLVCLSHVLRDLLMFLLLLLLVNHALKRACKASQRSPKEEQFTIHEVDPALLDQLITIESQLSAIQELALSTQNTADLARIAQKVRFLKEQLLKTSPATIFLGPLGTASIVLKEREIARQLLNESNSIGALLDRLVGIATHTPATSLDESLSANAKLIRMLQPTPKKEAPIISRR